MITPSQTQQLSDNPQLPRLLRVAQHLSEQKDVPRLLEALLTEVLYLCHADTGWVWLYADSRPRAAPCGSQKKSATPA